jgi:hypothetical protein
VSVYKPERSPYYAYDFQVRGRRFFGTTGATERRQALEVERRKKREAKDALAKNAVPVGAPMTFDFACARYWLEIGQYHKRSDQTEWSLKWLVEAIGKTTLISAIDDVEVARIVAKRRGEPVVNVAAQKGGERDAKRQKGQRKPRKAPGRHRAATEDSAASAGHLERAGSSDRSEEPSSERAG